MTTPVKCRCGSTATTMTSRVHGWFVTCSACNLSGPMNSFSQTGAIEAWNALMAPASPMQSGDGREQRETFDPTFTDTQTPPGFVEAFRKTFAANRAKPTPQTMYTWPKPDSGILELWYRHFMESSQSPTVSSSGTVPNEKPAPACFQPDEKPAWVAEFWKQSYHDIITDIMCLLRRKEYDTLDRIAAGRPAKPKLEPDEAETPILKNKCATYTAPTYAPCFEMPDVLRRYNGTAPDIAWLPSPVRRWLARAAWLLAGAAALAAAWVVATGKVLP